MGLIRVIKYGLLAALWPLASCHTAKRIAGSKGNESADSIYRILKRTADWQIDSIAHRGWRHPAANWTNGALYAGILEFAQISPDSGKYDSWLENIGAQQGWKLVQGRGRYHADNYCVGQMYCGVYAVRHQPVMIADLRLLADTLIARPHTESLAWKNNIGMREWAWCDALFMGPPALAMLSRVSGQLKYMDLVDSLWWKTTGYLYDPGEHLYFRDGSFLNKKEKNGKKMFWSRGNGWVMGGLVRVIQNMPANYPDRDRWLKLYRQMAERIASLQQPDGTWHASLLDPGSYPVKETSGSTFYCYALAWGVNRGILDRKKYGPVVWKAWHALVACLHPNGMLGYVQRIGGAPDKVSYDDTEVYGIGAFLMAGSQVWRLARNSGS